MSYTLLEITNLQNISILYSITFSKYKIVFLKKKLSRIYNTILGKGRNMSSKKTIRVINTTKLLNPLVDLLGMFPLKRS